MRKFIDNYYYNFLQLLNMTSSAFIIPQIIGLKEYGKYTALFSIPGVIQVLIESLFISTFRNNTKSKIKKITIVSYIIAFVTLISISVFLFTSFDVFLISLLLISMLERVRWSVLFLYQSTNIYTKVSQDVELKTFLINIIFILIGITRDYHTYLLPFSMIFTSMTVSIFLFFTSYQSKYITTHTTKNTESEINKYYVAPFIRTFEELFLTLPPLLISKILSFEEAGKFRISISIVKFLFKLYPLRYDLVIAEYHNRLFNHSIALKFSLFIILLPIFILSAIWISDNKTIINVLANTSEFILAIGGTLVVNSILGPLAVLQNPSLIIISICFFIVTVITAFVNWSYYYIVYSCCSILYTIIIYKVIYTQSINNPIINHETRKF